MPFPSNPVRDDFDRAGPALGSAWDDVGPSAFIGGFDCISNMANPAEISSCSVWNVDGVLVDQEAYVTFQNVAHTGALGWGSANWGGVALRVRQLNLSSLTYDSYRLRCTANAATPEILVERVGNNSIQATLLTISGADATFVAGDGFGASVSGTSPSIEIKVYRRTGIAGTWDEIGSVTDSSSLLPDGYPGLCGRGNDTYLDDFGGGEMVEALELFWATLV